MRYRLTATEHRPISDSRLALVVGQAVALARQGRHPRIASDDGHSITVDKDGGVLAVTWVPARTSLFDPPAEEPRWVDTARQILSDVYTDADRTGGSE
jgi:hypothetical protein